MVSTKLHQKRDTEGKSKGLHPFATAVNREEDEEEESI